jgi:hypothetical protein
MRALRFRTASRQPEIPGDARWQEIARRLATRGLARAPRRGLRFGRPPGPAVPRPLRPAGRVEMLAELAEALAGLGPVCGSLVKYLATRADLFRLDECRRLADAAGAALDVAAARSAPAGAAELESLLVEDLGAPLAELFGEIEPAPWAWSWLDRSHRARLPDGRAVLVTVSLPVAADSPGWDLDLELLPELAAALAGGPLGELPWDEALADFAGGFRRGADLAARARDLAVVAGDAADFPLLYAPRLVRERCGPRVLTREEPAGGAPGQPPGGSISRPDLARRIALAWLRQALAGSVFPAGFERGDLTLLASGQVAFTGSQARGLPLPSRSRLLDHLAAVAGDDPDRACSLLLPELATEDGPEGQATGWQEGEPEDQQVAELRARLRQVVPFRDGAWRDGGSGDTLAEQLCVNFRLASEQGFPPRPPLLRFVRGLAAVALELRACEPLEDSLREGLEDLRASLTLARWRQAVTLDGLSGAADRYAAAMLELPQRLEEVLTRAARGELVATAPGPATAAGRGGASGREQGARQDAAAAAAALGLAAVAVGLLTSHFAAGALGPWGERLGTGIFVVLALLLLRTAGRAA